MRSAPVQGGLLLCIHFFAEMQKKIVFYLNILMGMLSTYHKPGCTNRNIPPSPLKRFIERHKSAKPTLLIFVLLGACMVVCIGALTLAISGKGIFFTLSGIMFLVYFLSAFLYHSFLTL